SRLPGVVALILGITALMLFVAFRSVLVPLKAVLLNCLSVSSAFGVTVLVFQHGYGGRLFGLDGPTEAIFVVVPVLIFATGFGRPGRTGRTAPRVFSGCSPRRPSATPARACRCAGPSAACTAARLDAVPAPAPRRAALPYLR